MIHNHDKKYVGLPGKDVNGFVNSIMRKQDLPIFSTKEYDFHQEQIEHSSAVEPAKQDLHVITQKQSMINAKATFLPDYF